ncbi:MAG: DUF1538 domain-containing protein [Atribacterota bacterium]|jgi:hypothetical protein|nr:DUF1538 domain-containing protein [Atribacterota bacterium]MDD4895407.1 DUF1538 domain-containing protein [Atribacterota bacterium]MDD5638122.1 DUF1538 domain-containing protein [Atribacterota bacterium]
MNIKNTMIEVLQAILPITIAVFLLQFTIIRLPIREFMIFLFGVVLTFSGFILFLIGVRYSLLPIGEEFGIFLMKNENLWLVIGLGIALGFAVTISEPGLQILADQVMDVSNGEIPKSLLMVTVSLGLGIFLALSLVRIIYKISLRIILLGSYILVFLLAIFSSPNFFAVSFDAGGVTTGPMTVPFILAFGVGMSSVSGAKTTSGDSFGFVGLASVGPILAVLILGMIF